MTSGQSERTREKRERILETAMRHFAERGFEAARVEDMAAELGIAKGSVFQHFGSKGGLLVAAYKKAVTEFSAWLDAPPEIKERGFFAVVRYWLEITPRMVREDWVLYRVALIGNYATDLSLRREINRFLRTEDPYGTAEFVRLGLERGELRRDVDPDLIASILDWTMERFQDAQLTEELDPGLFRRAGMDARREAERIEQFQTLLRSAIGAPGGAAKVPRPAPRATGRRPRSARRKSA
jgi:AcrR family transcriptional regulator